MIDKQHFTWHSISVQSLRNQHIIMNQIESPTPNEIKVTVDDSDGVQKCFFHAHPNHHEKFLNNPSMNLQLNIIQCLAHKNNWIRVRNNQISLRRSNCRVFFACVQRQFSTVVVISQLISTDQLCQKSDALAARKLLPLNVWRFQTFTTVRYLRLLM